MTFGKSEKELVTVGQQKKNLYMQRDNLTQESRTTTANMGFGKSGALVLG